MNIGYADSIVQADYKVQALLSGFVEKTYAFISTTFKTPLLICLLLYIIFIGYGVMNGWFQLVWKEFSMALIKLVVTSSLIFNWPFFQTILVNFFTVGASDMVQALTSHVFYQSSVAMQGSTESISQGLLVEVASVGLWVWKMASFSSPLPIFFGIILWVCGVGVIIYGIIQIMIGKIMITLLLAASPIILVFMLFTTTSKVTWAWLQLLLSNLLVLMLVSLSLNLSFYLLHDMFDDLYKVHGKGIVVLQLIPVILMSVLSFFMIKRCVSAAFYMGSQVMPGGGGIKIGMNMKAAAIKIGAKLLR